MKEEIIKLFKNAEADRWVCSQRIQKYCREGKGSRDPLFNPYPVCCGEEACTKDCKDIIFNRYFSEEMQLEVFKVLIEGRWIEFAHYRKGDLGSKSYYAGTVNFKNRFEAETFDETLAGIVNLLWSSMNNEDKNKIKKILGG